jgi:type IV secretion system protein VirB10
MKLFSQKSPADEESGRTSSGRGDALSGTPDELEEAIAGDRGIPSVNRARSLQSRVSSVLAITLMTTLGVGLLTWYYAKALTRPRQAQQAAQVAVKNRAQGEMALPSLGRIQAPFGHADPAPTVAATPAPDPSTMEGILGQAPPLPESQPSSVGAYRTAAAQVAGDASRPKSSGELALERRLAGPAFARGSKDDGGSGPASVGAQNSELAAFAASHTRSGEEGGEAAQGLNTLLRPTVTPAIAASVLPTRRFLLAKGAFIDCTLETAIDSTLPGMTTCITATDTFSADGTVVLLERGTKLVGETRGQVQQGSARLFVLWTEARTPTGVVVPLNSPGTDELGRAGLVGEVNRHFWDRFGAAILMTVINGAVQGAVNSQNKSGSVSISPSTSTDVMSDVLRSTVNIPPTITKAQGDRIQVFVARDVDFRPVYALRVTSSAVPPEAKP